MSRHRFNWRRGLDGCGMLLPGGCQLCRAGLRHAGRLLRRGLPDRARRQAACPPVYAPELNPVEKWWANLKGSQLANLCAETPDEPIRAARRGVERVCNDEDLLFGFLRATGLSP